MAINDCATSFWGKWLHISEKFREKMKCGGLFIVMVSAKLCIVYIILTRNDRHNFGQTNWPDNFDRPLYITLHYNVLYCIVLYIHILFFFFFFFKIDFNPFWHLFNNYRTVQSNTNSETILIKVAQNDIAAALAS